MRERSKMLAAVVVASLLGACQTPGGGDKTGGETLVLQLATIDGEVNGNGQLYGPQAFVKSLEEVSGGRLRVEVTSSYGDGAAKAESNIVEAIAAGDLDGGWPSVRAFANAGITGLEVVEAPMTITSYDAERALVSGAVSEELLTRLDGSGVVGLGLAVGPLRRPFAADAPLLEPADWEGARFRVYNSPVQDNAVRALGGKPANLGLSWIEEVEAGTLRGAEFDVAQYAQAGLTKQAGNVTANVVLWPKVFVLSFSQDRWETLTDEQQQWVREAADTAVQASIDATYDETTPAQQLCKSGVRFVAASPDQIRDLRTALQPVVDQLATDAHSRALLKDIQAIASEHSQPEAVTVPDSCRSGTSRATKVGSIPDGTSALPDGVFRVEISTEDVAAAGLTNSDGNSGTWTLTIRGGTYELTCRPIDDPGLDCGHTDGGPLEVGDLRGTGHTVYFVSAGSIVSTYRADWATDGQTLTFSDSVGAAWEWLIEPWHRID